VPFTFFSAGGDFADGEIQENVLKANSLNEVKRLL
jgi:hypothetical protein